MIEIEWKPNIRKERIALLLPPLPNPEACESILKQPLLLKHYRNTLHTLCRNEEIPYIIVYVPNFDPHQFIQIECFERLYGIEVRLISKMEKLYTSIEYCSTLTHECVYMLSDPDDWRNQTIPLEWFFDIFIQDALYPFYDELQYWIAKELKKYLKPHSGSNMMYERCLISKKFMTSLESLLNKLLGLKKPPSKEDALTADVMELEASLIPNADANGDPDPDEDADHAQESPESTESSKSTEDSTNEHDWIIVVGNIGEHEKKTLTTVVKALQSRGCLKWIYTIEDFEAFNNFPKGTYHRLSSAPLKPTELQSLAVKFQRAICSFYLPVSLLWIGQFDLETPEKRIKLPEAYYSPEAWSSLNPDTLYGATHAKTDWILYEPIGCLHALAQMPT